MVSIVAIIHALLFVIDDSVKYREEEGGSTIMDR